MLRRPRERAEGGGTRVGVPPPSGGAGWRALGAPDFHTSPGSARAVGGDGQYAELTLSIEP